MKKTLIFSFFALLLSVFLFGCKKVNPTVSIELQANKNSISYSLTFTDIEESSDRKYKIELSKDSTKVVEKVNSVLTKTGEFANLDFNTEYTFTVYISANKSSEEYTTKLGEKKISTELQTFEGVTFESKEFIYDGQAKSIEVSGQPEGTKVEYTNNACTEVGTHEVTAKLSKAGYNDLVLTAKITIVKGQYDFALENKTKTYDGKPLEVTADTNLELTYEYYSGETKLTTAPTNAGTYTVKAIYAGDANHEGFTKTATLVINKANCTIVAQDVTKTYDGEAAIVSATVSNGGTAVITYNTEDGQAPVNAGTYTATVSYAGNNNYNAAANVTVNIVINKAASTLELEDKEVTYNGQAQTIEADTELSVTYEYYNGESKLSEAPINAGTYTVKAIYAGDLNTAETSAEATLVIKKADVIITAADVNKTYDGEAAQVTATVSNDATPIIEYSTTDKQAPVNAGTYTATITYAGDNNYNAATKTVNVVITKATVELELEDKEVTFDGAAHTIEADTELDVTYEYYQGTTKLDAAPKNAGTYTVKAIYAGNENVAGKTVEATLIIKRADVNISAEDVAKEYDGEVVEVAATLSNGAIPTIIYKDKDGNTLLSAPLNIGVYTATISYEGNENYNSAQTVIVNINITSPGYTNLTIVATPVEATYNESYTLEYDVTGSDEVTKEDLRVKYYDLENNEISKPINAGTYKAIISYDKNDILFINAVIKEVSIIINKANTTITADDVTKKYDGESAGVTATVSNGEIATIIYSTEDGEAPVNVGTYTATVSYAGNNNYNAAEDVTVTIVIEKATTIITPTVTEIVVTYGDNYEVEATISNNDTNFEVTYYKGNTKLEEAPVNAGSYKAVISYSSDNYTAESVTVIITIEAKVEVITVGDQIKDKNFDKGVLSVKLTSSEEKVTYSSEFKVVTQNIDTTQSNFDVTILYNSKEYTVNVTPIAKPELMIYAAYGGGGNSGALYKNDFIILFNNSSQDINLEGYSIQNTGATTAVSTSKVALTGVIKAYSFYTIQCKAGTKDAEDLPFTPDLISNNINLNKSDFHVVLVPFDTYVDFSDSNANIIDLVAVNGSYPEEEATAAVSNTTFVRRKKLDDSNNNKNDFEVLDLTADSFVFLTKEGWVANEVLLAELSKINFDFLASNFKVPVKVLGNNVTWLVTGDTANLSIDENGIVTVVLDENGVTKNVNIAYSMVVGDTTYENNFDCQITKSLAKPTLSREMFTITWNAIANAKSYTIYCNSVAVTTVTATGAETYSLDVYEYLFDDNENLTDTTIYVVANPVSEILDAATSDNIYFMFADSNDLEEDGYIFNVYVTAKGSKYTGGVYAVGVNDNRVYKIYVTAAQYSELHVGTAYYIDATYSTSNGLVITPTTILENAEVGVLEENELYEEYTDETEPNTYGTYYLENAIITNVSGSTITVSTSNVATINLYTKDQYSTQEKTNLYAKLKVGYVFLIIKGYYQKYNSKDQLYVLDFEITAETQNDLTLSKVLEDQTLVSMINQSYTISEAKNITLKETDSYENVILSYSVTEGASITGNVMTIAVPETETTITLTITIALESNNTVFKTKTVEINVSKATGDETEKEPEVVATFDLGKYDENKNESDGSAAASYSETNNDYTFSFENATGVYKNSYDGGHNCTLKLGTSSAAGAFTFTVSGDIKYVVIYVAGYKTNTAKININDTEYTITTGSTAASYTEVKIDTTTNKTISITTLSGGWRCKIDKIEYYA